MYQLMGYEKSFIFDFYEFLQFHIVVDPYILSTDIPFTSFCLYISFSFWAILCQYSSPCRTRSFFGVLINFRFCSNSHARDIPLAHSASYSSIRIPQYSVGCTYLVLDTVSILSHCAASTYSVSDEVFLFSHHSL